MNVLYCGDKGIVDGLLISVLSLIKNAKSLLHIYILTINYDDSQPITEKTTQSLDKLVKESNANNFVKRIDATEIFVKNLPSKNMDTIFTKKYFKPCAMLRLYIDKVPELCKLEKILYLDYDVICRQDPTDFYNTNMQNVEVAGTLDIYGKYFYHYHFPKIRSGNFWKKLKKYQLNYMNSGVLLFNMSECKKTDLFPRAVKVCQTRRMMLADQAALNIVISRRKIMPLAFNEQHDHPKKDTVFHHFSNNFKFWPYFHVQKIKPFEVEKIHKILKIIEYDDIFDKYSTLKKEL